MKRNGFKPIFRGAAAQTARRSRAFTLVEVLATLVLLGIVLPVAMRGTSLALAAASHAQHLSQATSLAQVKLGELVMLYQSNQPLSSGASGDFAPDYPDYKWTYQSTQNTYCTEHAVQVTWAERGQQRSLNMATWTYP